jgi:hypothetical protein
MAFNGRINLPKSRNVYRMPELLNTILEYCDHSTVMAVSRVDCHGRLQAQNEIRSRIRSLVTQFIDSNHFLSFMNMLATTGAVIIGSVARRLFTINAIYMEDLRGESQVGLH